MTQRGYVKRRGVLVAHAIDVHWRLANPQLFARLLSHDEMWLEAVPIPALGAAARGPSAPHALLIACVHRVAHHRDSDSLIWLSDIDRLARRLTPGEWATFVGLATLRRVVAVCATSLASARRWFETPVPAAVADAWLTTGAIAEEPSAAYLNPPRTALGAAIRDWRALSSWQDRARLAREHLAPRADYMRTVYAPGSRAPLGWLYLRRVTGGLRKPKAKS